MSRGMAAPSTTPGYSRPSAVERKVRYVGALPRNEERIPLAEKKWAGSRTAPTTNAIAPSSPARSIASAGMIVVKMAANRIATSRIGAHEYSFSCRMRGEVVNQDPASIARSEEHTSELQSQSNLA